MHTERLPLSRYWPLGKVGFLCMVSYGWECVFASVSSLLTVIVGYYLWSAIFQGAATIDPQLSFASTFAYIGVSAAILTTFNTSIESSIARQITSGDVIRNMVRPVDFHLSQVSTALGSVALRSFFGLIPCMTLVLVLLPAGWIRTPNYFLFALSLVGALAILLHLDMLTGLIAVRTEAVWGIKLAKDYVVLISSGALIPIDWLPASVAKVLMLLPFQAICHTPVKLLTNHALTGAEIIHLFGMQWTWALLLIFGLRAALAHMLRKIEVNGG